MTALDNLQSQPLSSEADLPKKKKKRKEKKKLP